MYGSIKQVVRVIVVLALLLAVCPPLRSQQFPGSGQEWDSLHQELGSFDPFTLTDQNGKAFSSEQLRGKVWVAHFFYVTCRACNLTNPVIDELQKRIRGRPDLLIVSISLNGDSPEDLKRFSEDWKADPSQWLFLTGPKEKVHELFQKSFNLGMTEDVEAPLDSVIQHDSKLIIVDRQGIRQGYIDRNDPSAVERLFPRMRQIAAARYSLSGFNAVLNTLSAVLLIVGYVAIRWRFIALHKSCMLTALATSAIFLSSYLFYHFVVLQGESPRFPGAGIVRYVYLAILLTHTILAAVVAPLALTVTYQGLRNNLSRHVSLARWTLPIWLYVSITGVVVYWMLYQLYPRF